MLKINESLLELGQFPDGTMLTHIPLPQPGAVTLTWRYENDSETLALYYAVNHLKAHGFTQIHLVMPYIPNARQDRVKTDDDVFTLKYFARLINGLGFATVTVRDPHSSVSEALIDHLVMEKPKAYIEKVIAAIETQTGKTPAMFYPDEGAGKRYGGQIELPYAFGIKRRDWKTGKILGLDVAGDTELIAGSDVLIVDDICSKGGTFYHSAKRLKELGAGRIWLFVTHCENTILQGELLEGDLIEGVYTTESIFTKEHERVCIVTL